MAQMSDYLEEALMNHTFRNIPFTTPGIVHLALYSTDPTDADVGTELEVGSSPGYARMSLDTVIGAPADGVSTNGSEILFGAATGDWVGVTHVGIRDESAGGNLLAYKALSGTISVLSGNNLRIPIDNLTLTFA